MRSRSHRIAVVLRVQKARLFQICFKIARDLCDTVCKGYDSMTIRKRLARSNLVMILIPVAIAAALLLAGGGLRVTLTLPRAQKG